MRYHLHSLFKAIFVISLFFTSFCTSAQQPKVREYLLWPLHERYNNNYWVQVEWTLFKQLHAQADSPEIAIDTSVWDTPIPEGFRIFIDKGGNRYYWVHPVIAPDTITTTFSPEEKEMEDELAAFAALFIVRYPYGEDTARKGTEKYAKLQLRADSLDKIGYDLRRDPEGNILTSIAVTNYGYTHIDMVLKSIETGKQVLIKGESNRYGRLCILLRYLKESPSSRQAIHDFLVRYGRTPDLTKKINLEFIISFFRDVMPEALAKLPHFKPFPIQDDNLEGTRYGDSEKVIGFGSGIK